MDGTRTVGEAQLRAVSERLLDRALRAGAGEAEVFAQSGHRVHVQVNRGRVENLTRAGAKGVGVRVFLDGRLAFLSTTDFTPATLDRLVDETVALAAEATPEPWNGLPAPAEPSAVTGIHDPTLAEIPLEEKIERARTLDRLVFEEDALILGTEGAAYSDGTVLNVLLSSRGTAHAWRESLVSMVVSPVAGRGEQKQVAHDWSAARAYAGLRPVAEIVSEACRRAIQLLGGEPVPTQKVPVVMHPAAGTSLLEGIAQAVDGEDVYRGRSFLADRLGQKIGSDRVTVIDDGTLPRGLATSPVDGEGVPTGRKCVIERGVLRAFLYDTYTARKAGTASTGNAVRDSYSARPAIGAFNFYLEAGDRSPEEIVGEVDRGFYVFRTLGGGPNVVTGDFSAGAAGVWIEGGKITRPVARVTIAAPMLEMLSGIDAVGNDLEFKSPTATPTYRIREMTVSGV